LFTGPALSGYSWNSQVPRAPSHAQGVTSRAAMSRITSAGITPPSSLLQAHAPVPHPPTACGQCLGRRVFAGCCQPLLGVRPSRHYLCRSFPACLDPYSGCPQGALARFFPQGVGLPRIRTGSTHHTIPTATSVRARFRSCSHSLMFRPTGLLATLVAPTLASFDAGQLWLFHPRPSRFVTLPCRGYANRPNRAIDGKGTPTPQYRQPCRLLP